MASVTQIVSKTTQPRGGFLPMKFFKKEVFDDGCILNESENIHASLVGMAVDYLTRFSMGASVDQAFHISCLGATCVGKLPKAEALKKCISGLDDLSITSACKLAGFDVCYRSSISGYKPVETINPDKPTIENIRIMVTRSIAFWNKYGPVVCSEPTFTGGYTDTVDSGDGDYLSADTLWDFKVSKTSPTSKHSLQILMYYIMGLHSIHDQYSSITKLGFFNPRLNTVYICPINSIPADTITIIENDVLCYGDSTRSEKKYIPIKSPSNNHTQDYTVADVCQFLGVPKSTVYADIRIGRLYAYKKGNKYYISASNFTKYSDYIKRKQIILWSFCIGLSVILLLLFIYMFSI